METGSEYGITVLYEPVHSDDVLYELDLILLRFSILLILL
jgi:hypothetical protein